MDLMDRTLEDSRKSSDAVVRQACPELVEGLTMSGLKVASGL